LKYGRAKLGSTELAEVLLSHVRRFGSEIRLGGSLALPFSGEYFNSLLILQR
jgi:hypothetical protein